jgi:hypothetical protein
MSLPRYVRETEHAATAPAPVVETLIPRTDVATRAAHSPLSPGAQDLLTGLCRLARPSVFPGGGVGIEYSALLKSAVNPAYLQRHAQEAAAHLREQRVDLLLVPGMSGYPVGSVYASVSGIPAVLLKKQAVPADRGDLPAYPVGSFISSSYTGDGDVVMSADPGAVQDTIDHILTSQVAAQADRPRLRLELRLAGADDIIDKGVMSRAVSESGIVLSRSAARTFLDRYRATTGDDRDADVSVSCVAWVTPLIKSYNRPSEQLAQLIGVTPFAGLTITTVQIDPPAIGVANLGLIAF